MSDDDGLLGHLDAWLRGNPDRSLEALDYQPQHPDKDMQFFCGLADERAVHFGHGATLATALTRALRAAGVFDAE